MNTLNLPSKSNVYKQINACGVSNAILKRVLPQWWHDDLLSTGSGFLQFTQILRQQLGIKTEFDESGRFSLNPEGQSIQFKKRATTELKKLTDSTLLASAASKTILRTLRYNEIKQNLKPLIDMLMNTNPINLEGVLEVLWTCGIPVLYLDRLPSSMPRPAGIVSRENDDYVIMLSHRHKSCSTQLFVLLHEIGHIVSGHLPENGMITDDALPEFGEVLREENDLQEKEADEFALYVLRKGVDVPKLISEHGRMNVASTLVLKAKQVKAEYGIPEGHYILTYGRQTRDWPLAQNALKFVDKTPAQAVLKAHFLSFAEQLEIKADDKEYLHTIQEL